MSFAVVNGRALLASGSLDSYIRLWAFRPVSELTESYQKSKHVYFANQTHFVMLESVLFGHTEGISGLNFFKDLAGKSRVFCNIRQTCFQQFRLLSASLGGRQY